MARDASKIQRKLESAVTHFRAGRLEEAARAARKVLAAIPADASALNLLAAIASNQNQHDDAKEYLLRALRSQPRNPFIFFNLGEVCSRLGMTSEAMSYFKKAIALKPEYEGAYQHLGDIARSAGDWDTAAKAYQAALAVNPAIAAAHYGLGRVFMATGDNKGAAACLDRALRNIPLRSGPLAAAVCANLGVARMASGLFAPGLHVFCEAIECDPGWNDAWRLFAQYLANTAIVPVHPRFREYLLSLLTRADINPRPLASAAVVILKADGRWQSLLRIAEQDGARSLDFQSPQLEAWRALAGEPLFLSLLCQAPIPDTGFEVLLTAWRRHLLLTPGALDAVDLDSVSALATQCFLNEYVYASDSEEEASLEALLARLAAGPAVVGPSFWAMATLAACYTTLGKTPVPEWAIDAPAALAALCRMHIEEPGAESALRETLSRLKPIQDELSRSVQRQYEANPFPRWIRCTRGAPLPVGDVVRRALPHLREEKLPETAAPDILIAGCGTGMQTMHAVDSYLNAKILAVDISAASLAYSLRKLRECGVQNVRHLHADILDLDSLEEQFDLIECFGVLHHMADSQHGLNVLARRLRPGGLMLLGLYSTIARQSVVAARAVIAAKGYRADASGIRTARREFMARQGDPAFAPLVSPASDFWTMSECRDLLFNVQEHRFTLLEIETMLQAVGLEFLGLQPSNLHDAMRFAQMFPQPEALRSLKAWHRFEEENPLSFGETYRFWVRKPAGPNVGSGKERP